MQMTQHLYHIDKSPNIIETKLQNALVSLSEWCKQNGMLINTAKTKVMLITTYQKRVHLRDNSIQLTYQNDELHMTNCDKVLGVNIDNNLTWSSHIDKISK